MRPPSTPRLAVAIAGWVLATSALAAADSPLARLADRAAAEIERTAKGAVLELPPTEDRTGRGLAPDLHALLLARLRGRVTLASSGPRLRIASVVSETPGRLSFSARVQEEPGGTLVDLLLVVVSAGSGDLSFAPERPLVPNDARLEVVRSQRTTALSAPVLDLAFLGSDRLLVLSADEASVYRWTNESLSLLARRALPGPLSTVRAPGGMLVPSAGENSFWALTSRAARAALLVVSGNQLEERQRADAVPWPGAPRGLRYRPGTNLIEGTPVSLGPGPFVDLDGAQGGIAIDASGRLVCSGCPGQRVGLGIAGLWQGFLATSSPAPPGAGDALLVLERGETGIKTWLRLPVEGALRAMSARVDDHGARVVTAIEPAAGGCYLLILDLAKP